MAVSSVVIWATRPGRAMEFLATAAKAKAIHERLGGKVRLRQIVFGGPSSQQFAYSIEYADMTAFATFSDKMAADPEWIALWAAAANAPDPTTTLVSQSLATDVPGF